MGGGGGEGPKQTGLSGSSLLGNQSPSFDPFLYWVLLRVLRGQFLYEYTNNSNGAVSVFLSCVPNLNYLEIFDLFQYYIRM